MTVLLLCGYRNCDPHEPALGADVLDQRILELRRLGLSVICVLAGQHADEQLRLCRRIADTELVFDTHEEPNLATNLKAGLAATDGAGCFVLPLEVPCPPKAAWETLRESWRQNGFHTSTSIYQLADSQGAPSHLGFPLLVTRSGNKTIQEMQGFRSLVDTRLKYLHLSESMSSDLASLDFPL